mgnify:CR=1 FL=1|jgi:archaellum component FlaC
MEDRLRRIEDKIDKLQRSIDILIDDNENIIKNNCKKMGTHIEFVEKIYDNVKSPLGYICHRVSNVSGSNKYSLENKK